MGSTAIYGIPYPEPSEPVRQGAAAIQSTAQRVSDVIAALAGGGAGLGFRAGSSVVHTDSNGAAIIPINPAFTVDVTGGGIGCYPIAMNGDASVTYIPASHTPQAWRWQWTVIVKQSNGSPLINSDIRVNWIAIGVVT